MSSIEVCVVAYANAETIKACISSLALLGRSASVALADNHPDQSSVDLAARAAASAGLPFRSISRPDNPGFAISCNQLAAASSADYLFFLNPDAVVRAWPGQAALASGLVAPRILGSDGRRQPAYGRRRNLLDEVTRRLQIPPRDPQGVGYVSGAAMLIPRTEFLDVGGFDERYFMYYEDIDLCRSLVERGGTVRIDPTFVVEHIGGFSANSVPAATALRSYDSARRYYSKWNGSTLGLDVVVVLDSALKVAARRVGLSIPGAEGAASTLTAARENLRTGLRRRSSTDPSE